MKNFQTLTTLVGIFPVISNFGARRQSTLGLGITEFSGRFSLPFDAEWGEMVLPEGDYSLYFGSFEGGVCFVEIAGQDPANPKGIFLVHGQDPASVVQNALVCVYRDGSQIIRALELPAIGKSVSFAAPHAQKSPKNRGTAKFQTRLAGAPN